MKEAVAVFKLNTMEYPEAANPYDSLGDAYAAMGNYKEAEDLYKKASSIASQQNHPNKELYKSKYENIKKRQEN